MECGSLLGIDIGSGACKLTLIDFCGNVLATVTKEYPTYYPRPGWAEQEPEDWYDALCQAVGDMTGSGVRTSEIVAVCLSAPTHTAVLLDRDFRVIRKAILWTDQRSVSQSERLSEDCGADIFRVTLNHVSPVWTLPQLMWIKENEPDVWQKISVIMFAKDYVRWRLTDLNATDWIDAMGSMLFDGTKLTWSSELCELLGLPISKLPPVMAPSDIAGVVTKRAADETGLAEGTRVLVGTTDTAMEVFGAGATEPGQCTIKLATAGRICVITDDSYPHKQLFNYRHVLPGRWYPGTGTKSCASSYRWFRDAFCGSEVEAARSTGSSAYKIMDAQAAKIPMGSEGLIFHPYLLGELSPYNDPSLRASFIGATMRHSKAHFARAVLEGVAFSLRDCMLLLEEIGMPLIRDIRLIGGGARSSLWRQIVCDVLGRSAAEPCIHESSFGGAMLAGLAVGVFEDTATAVSRCVKMSDVIEPDMENHEKYKKLFEIYKETQDMLRRSYEKMASLTWI